MLSILEGLKIHFNAQPKRACVCVSVCESCVGNVHEYTKLIKVIINLSVYSMLLAPAADFVVALKM